MQSYEETEACAETARALGVGSLNLDLIYGLPLQTEEGVARTARRALGLKADRVAVFGYAHVPWMKKHQALIPDEQLPGPAERYAQLNAIHRVLIEEGGYVAIGLDHYALPSDAMAKAAAARRLRRGFQGYTTDGAPALIGFGASSIGSLPQGYVQNAPTAAAYLKEIEAGRLATVRGVAVTPDDRLRRDVIERVMCDLEVDVEAVAAEHGADPAPLVEAASDGLREVRRGRAGVVGRAADRGQRDAAGRSCAPSRRCSTPISRRRATSRATRARWRPPLKTPGRTGGRPIPSLPREPPLKRRRALFGRFRTLTKICASCSGRRRLSSGPSDLVEKASCLEGRPRGPAWALALPTSGPRGEPEREGRSGRGPAIPDTCASKTVPVSPS